MPYSYFSVVGGKGETNVFSHLNGLYEEDDKSSIVVLNVNGKRFK